MIKNEIAKLREFANSGEKIIVNFSQFTDEEAVRLFVVSKIREICDIFEYASIDIDVNMKYRMVDVDPRLRYPSENFLENRTSLGAIRHNLNNIIQRA